MNNYVDDVTQSVIDAGEEAFFQSPLGQTVIDGYTFVNEMNDSFQDTMREGQNMVDTVQ